LGQRLTSQRKLEEDKSMSQESGRQPKTLRLPFRKTREIG